MSGDLGIAGTRCTDHDIYNQTCEVAFSQAAEVLDH